MKKQQQIKLGLTALSLLVLTACGGGGGDSSSSETPAPINPTSSEQPATPAQTTPAQPATPTETPTTPAQPQPQPQPQPTTPTPSEPSNPVEVKPLLSGAGFNYAADKTKPANTKSFTTISDNLNEVVIDGQKFNVIPNTNNIDITTISTVWLSDNIKSICCGTRTNIKSVKIGDFMAGDQIYAFYNGAVTPESNVPQKGTMRYSGGERDTIRFISMGDEKVRGYFPEGDVELTADFDNKAIKGSAFNEAILLEGAISGAAISGTAVFNENATIRLDDDTEHNALTILQINEGERVAPLNGAFFGEKAEEIAGEAHNGKWGVVFAAEQQK
ncbi:transferrin-binding protein-like solute binding protein [Testudinibacter aquarius]|uniref:Transferrin binding protein n=1 Tax=Testudinibacter aquarius TaxID=1524974 RepID=A0A4R3XVD5_9PAST|nr:transferrin-binding protein-like solute binding protein [Testudinibacter aquarius]KAE9527194.1 hypothetical protein A1D24_11760 [Testudinibacter aquarius]TCV82942.1 transferrin binding protein [Testudinibacter aquarius]TNG89974.1 transferrin-binding protein-like solute binding protein [Testudinibacter aquarius]